MRFVSLFAGIGGFDLGFEQSLRGWAVSLLVLVATIWRCVNVRGE